MSKRRLWLSLFGGAFVMLGLLWMVAWGGRAKVTAPQLPPPSTTTQLSAGDLAFGRQQVEQMMRDRSEMATCVDRGDIVYLWAVRQFAGEATGHHIYWNPTVTDFSPQYLSLSQASDREPFAGFIQIREYYGSGIEIGQKVDCDQLWSCAVFELYNIANSNDIGAIYDAALSGKISKQEWIQGMTKIEFKATRKTAQFYRSLWKPYAENKNAPIEPYYWFATQPDTYEGWISQYKDVSGYPYNHYSPFYDKNIAPYVLR